MDAKIKNEMEDRLGRLYDYIEDLSNHLANNSLEEVEYDLENMEYEVKAFLRNVTNTMEMEGEE